MDAKIFIRKIREHLNIGFYAGVPDSLLKPLCNTLWETAGEHNFFVCANEGAAAALCAGHYLASGKPGMVYMQNSGIGNAVNPAASLLDRRVYGIPALFVIGWRGEPGVKDEPQHVFQGQITCEMMDVLQIPYFILSADTSEAELDARLKGFADVFAAGGSAAVIVKKGALTGGEGVHFKNGNPMRREDAVRIIAHSADDRAVFVSTTGKTSRELFEIRAADGSGHQRDFLTVGSMGHADMIALAIALEKPDRTVYCLDGDGAALMHLGSLFQIGSVSPANLIHVVFNNEAHESVGGMPVTNRNVSFAKTAACAGYKQSFYAADEQQLRQALADAEKGGKPCLIEVACAIGSRSDLGRPTTTPQQNRDDLMDYLSGEAAAGS